MLDDNALKRIKIVRFRKYGNYPNWYIVSNEEKNHYSYVNNTENIMSASRTKKKKKYWLLGQNRKIENRRLIVWTFHFNNNHFLMLALSEIMCKGTKSEKEKR